MGNRRTRHTIQTRLFASYSILIVATLVAFGAIFWRYTSNVLEERTTASLATLSGTLLDRIDQEIHTMDAVSLSVAYAGLRRSEVQFGQANDPRTRESLPQLLGSILGPFLTVPELYLHEPDGTTIGVGLYTGSSHDTTATEPWVQRAVGQKGGMYLSLPHTDPRIDGSIPIYQGRKFVSLSRVYYDAFGKELGVVEVEQSVHSLFGGLASLEVGGPDTDIAVYSPDGSVMYSTGNLTGAALASYFAAIRRASAGEGNSETASLRSSYRQHRRVLGYAHSAYSGLTVMAVEPESYVFGPVYTFSRILVTGGMLVILVTLLLSFLVAKRLTIPIKTLHDAILKLDGERLFTSPPEKLESNLDELEELNAAFKRMHLKLRDSVEDLINLRSHEELTRMLSLQSQMKPHFLYNTLANISAMAEEGMNDRIVQLCDDLSAMYRYLGEGFSNLTTLKEELDFTRSYLSCMSYRLDDAVTCSCELSDELAELLIPKLTLQPLVENILKYGVIVGRPVEIAVKADSAAGVWTLTVEDNGRGFSEEAMNAVRVQLQAIEQSGEFEHEGSDGVGIANIYGRLRILYGSLASLHIARSPAGGASVSIGGTINVRFGA